MYGESSWGKPKSYRIQSRADSGESKLSYIKSGSMSKVCYINGHNCCLHEFNLMFKEQFEIFAKNLQKYRELCSR